MSDGPVTAVLSGDLNLLHAFAGHGINYLVVATGVQDLVLRSRYARRRAVIADARLQPQGAMEDLLRLGKSLPGRPALLFDNEPVMLLVSRNRERLEPCFRFLLPEKELIEDLASKVRFEGLARRLGLPTPRTVLSASARSASEALAEISPPCIFKPVTHVGWYDSPLVREEGGKPFKALLAETERDFRRLWEKMRRHAGEFVVQEFIPGGDDCIYSFHAYLDRQSRPLGCYVGRKIRTYPRTSGVSTYLELVKEPRVVEVGLDVLRRMNFVGPVKLDFKRDLSRDRYYLLEVNSRLNLWNSLGAACGIDLAHIAWRDLHGQPVEPQTEYETGVRWLSLGNDLRALRDYRREDGLSRMAWLLSLRGRKIYDVFAWRDPLPWCVCALRYQGRLWRKVVGRIMRALRHAKARGGLSAAASQNELLPCPSAPGCGSPASSPAAEDRADWT